MKKLGAAHPVWNRILGVVYLPLVFFCYIGLMAGERAIGELNPLIAAACYILGYGLFGISLTTYPALIFSSKCFSKGKRTAGHLLRWYPVWMIVVLVLIYELLICLSSFSVI